jgi:D-tagatose-1,6-bisphosphate aldolase subunit GatZ/KbaZ
MQALENAVDQSGRWKKWLQAEEQGKPLTDLTPQRREWLLQTGARYIWTQPAVVEARQELYANLNPLLPDPHAYVVERIARSMDSYVNAFGLFNSLEWFKSS